VFMQLTRDLFAIAKFLLVCLMITAFRFFYLVLVSREILVSVSDVKIDCF